MVCVCVCVCVCLCLCVCVCVCVWPDICAAPLFLNTVNGDIKCLKLPCVCAEFDMSVCVRARSSCACVFASPSAVNTLQLSPCFTTWKSDSQWATHSKQPCANKHRHTHTHTQTHTYIHTHTHTEISVLMSDTSQAGASYSVTSETIKTDFYLFFQIRKDECIHSRVSKICVKVKLVSK